MWTTQTKLFEQGDIKPMKYMKKLLTLLAVLTLALAMAVPAFAASGTGTITIDNAVTGTTYKADRSLDLESYDTGKKA